jgi:exonuclease III
MRIVTWNMDYWKHQSAHDNAWHWLFDSLNPDIALIQECVPPDRVGESGFLQWGRAYPEGQQPWGTALFSRLPAKPAGLKEVDTWLGGLPSRTAEYEGVARIHRLSGWAACAEINLDGLGETLVVSLHNPAREIERDRLVGVDVSQMKLELSDDLWLLDVVFFFLKQRLHGPLLIGGDFNYSRLLDDLYGNRAAGETASSCEVWDYDQVSDFSDHAPLVAELKT